MQQHAGAARRRHAGGAYVRTEPRITWVYSWYSTMSRTALMMSGFGDLSDEEETLSPSAARAACAATVAVQPRQPDGADLSRLERLERLAAQTSRPTPGAEVVSATAPALAAASKSEQQPVPETELEPESEVPEPEPELPSLQAGTEVAVEFAAAGPLGLNFRGGRPGEDANVVVAQVAAAGAAAGRVRPGMVLRSVQSVAVAGKTHDEVIESIRHSGRPLILVFSRPPPNPLPVAGEPANSVVTELLPEEIKATFASEGTLGESTVEVSHCKRGTSSHNSQLGRTKSLILLSTRGLNAGKQG